MTDHDPGRPPDPDPDRLHEHAERVENLRLLLEVAIAAWADARGGLPPRATFATAIPALAEEIAHICRDVVLLDAGMDPDALEAACRRAAFDGFTQGEERAPAQFEAKRVALRDALLKPVKDTFGFPRSGAAP